MIRNLNRFRSFVLFIKRNRNDLKQVCILSLLFIFENLNSAGIYMAKVSGQFI